MLYSTSFSHFMKMSRGLVGHVWEFLKHPKSWPWHSSWVIRKICGKSKWTNIPLASKGFWWKSWNYLCVLRDENRDSKGEWRVATLHGGKPSCTLPPMPFACVSVCVGECVCLSVCVSACLWVCVRGGECVWVSVCECVCESEHVCMSVREWVSVCVCVCVCVCGVPPHHPMPPSAAREHQQLSPPI